MEPWVQELIELWGERKYHIAVQVMEAIKNNPYLPVRTYTISDLQQMFEGFGAMIFEPLVSNSSDIRDTFMNSVIPGILSQGQSLSGFVGQITMNAIIVYNDIVPRASEANRARIGRFLTNSYVKFNSDNVNIGLSLGCKS